MAAISDAAVVKYDPGLWVNPKPIRAALADSLPMFSLDVVGEVAGFLINTNYIHCGQAAWEGLFGRASIGPVPEWPDDLDDELRKPSPFTQDRKLVGETHELMLFVPQVNGKQVTVRSIPEIFKAAHGILDTCPARREPLKYQSFSAADMQVYGDVVVPTAYWGLCIVDPQSKSFFFEYYASQISEVYQVISVRDLTLGMFMKHAYTGAFPVGDPIWCSEKACDAQLWWDMRSQSGHVAQVAVTHFDQQGLRVEGVKESGGKLIGIIRKLTPPSAKPKS